MELSVIIPYYNSGKFLPICLDSLINQGIGSNDYEILVINDGSTDDSLEIAQTYAKKHDNISVHSKPNGGVGSARNLGLELAQGKYIYFIDPDDYLAANSLGRLLQVARDNSLDILTFSFKKTKDSSLYHEAVKFDDIALSHIYSGFDYIAEYRYKNEVWCYLIEKDFMDSTGINFIEGRWMEDAILTTELFLKANRIAHLPIDVYRHLIVDGSAMTNKKPEHYLRVIDDNRNAAIVFEEIIESLEKNNVNLACIDRLRTRQQSFVFFMMVRMLKSTMKINQVKSVLNELSSTKAYPMKSFISEDYKGLSYGLLTRIFNSKNLFLLIFRVLNPILK